MLPLVAHMPGLHAPRSCVASLLKPVLYLLIIVVAVPPTYGESWKRVSVARFRSLCAVSVGPYCRQSSPPWCMRYVAAAVAFAQSLP